MSVTTQNRPHLLPLGTHLGRIFSGKDRIILLTAPALFFLLIVYLFPIIRLFALSIEFPLFDFEHYRSFFSDNVYLKVTYNTFKLAVVTTAVCLFIGYPTAYWLVKARPRLRSVLLVFVVIPYLTSFLVRTYAWIILLNDKGVVNQLLLGTGLVNAPIQLVFNTIGVYVGTIHVMLPLMILPLYSVMRGIDARLIMAAHSLGGSPLRSFATVFLPLSLPGVRSGCLLVFLIGLGFYITPALLGGLQDVMLVNLIDVQVVMFGNWGFASAASMVLLALTMIGLHFLGRSGAGDVFSLPDPAESERRGGVEGGARWNAVLRRRSPKVVADLMTGMRDALAELQRKRWEKSGQSSRRSKRLVQGGWICLTALALGFLLLPTLIVVPMSFSSASFLTFPPPGWSFRWYENFFASQRWVDATVLSFQVGLLTTACSTLLGTLAAYGLVRSRAAYRRVLMGVMVSPILVPPIVLGVGLYGIYSDLELIGTRLGLVLAHSISSMAFVVIIVTAALSRFDFDLERASKSLGAGPVRTFCQVTLPIIRPAILAAALFAFIHSFDELVITSLISGVGAKTLPIAMWENLRNEVDPTIAAVSTMLVFLPVMWLVVLEATNRLSKTKQSGIIGVSQ